MKCCVEIATPDGRLIPFCAYNNVGYREDVKDEMMKLRARERFAKIDARALAKSAAKTAENAEPSEPGKG
jgi:uncharacterized radical SAM superfamily Fe-S cluster-containing enzyme